MLTACSVFSSHQNKLRDLMVELRTENSREHRLNNKNKMLPLSELYSAGVVKNGRAKKCTQHQMFAVILCGELL